MMRVVDIVVCITIRSYSIKHFLISSPNFPGCSECGFQVYCGADPVFNHASQKDMAGHRPTNGFCKKNMEIIRYLFEKLLNEPIIESIFDSWLYKYDFAV